MLRGMQVLPATSVSCTRQHNAAAEGGAHLGVSIRMQDSSKIAAKASCKNNP